MRKPEIPHGKRHRVTTAKGAPSSSEKPSKKGETKILALGTKASARQVPLLPEHCPAPNIERISFGAYFPNANEVLLAGSFNDWQPSAAPLRNQGDGRWLVEVELERGRHEYRFVVDGTWIDDPMAAAYAINSFGILNCVLLVR